MAFAIVKFVRIEFGITNIIFEENLFLEEIFKIKSLDYAFEYQIISQKYQDLEKIIVNFKINCRLLTKKYFLFI